ncbi:MAG: NAD-dependent epimerase/dehydratase family protein [Myxococcota bacterium]
MKAFVTGSTGLLGNNLVRALVADGHQVVALTRSREKFDRMLGDTSATPVVGDIQSVDAFADSFEGCDVVFHTAAYFREYYGKGDHLTQLERINVTATLELMAAADARRVPAFIHTSSSGTIGHGPNGEPGNEDTPAPEKALRNLYFRSKVEGDAKIRSYAPSHGMRVVQILPGWMWGPGDAGPTGAGQIVLDFLAGKFPAVPDGGSTVADARDVAAGMIAAVDQPHGERFIIGGVYHSLRELIDLVAQFSGRPAPKGNLPSWFAIGYAHLAEAWATLTGGRAAANLEGVRTMALKHRVDSRKAQASLGVRFRPIEDTVKDVLDWYRDHGMAPSLAGPELSGPAEGHRMHP